MVDKGVMQNPKVDAVFGLHVFANVPAGAITYRSGPFMAAADRFDIVVTGKQAHGSSPWRGVDPISSGADRHGAPDDRQPQHRHHEAPAVVSVGQFQSGVRNNIIPDSAKLVGTIRTFDDEVQADIHARVKRIAEGIASGAGAKVEVTIVKGPPVTFNDPALTARMLPTLERVAPGKVKESELITGAEDFTFFRKQAPGAVFFPRHHAARAGRPGRRQSLAAVLRGRESVPTGVAALANLAVDYLTASQK